MDTKLLNSAKRHLCKTDTIMAKIIKQTGPIAPSKSSLPHFHSLVRAIINQQLSVKAGRTIEKRIQSKHGGRYFKAEKILKIKNDILRECGISFKKIHYIHTLAKAVFTGELNFRRLVMHDDKTIRDLLVQYPGIGQWSADMFLITSLRRPDVFPIGDLVLRKSMQKYYRLPADAHYDKYLHIARKWEPYRTIASLYLWKAAH